MNNTAADFYDLALAVERHHAINHRAPFSLCPYDMCNRAYRAIRDQPTSRRERNESPISRANSSTE